MTMVAAAIVAGAAFGAAIARAVQSCLCHRLDNAARVAIQVGRYCH